MAPRRQEIDIHGNYDQHHLDLLLGGGSLRMLVLKTADDKMIIVKIDGVNEYFMVLRRFSPNMKLLVILFIIALVAQSF